MDSMYSGAPSQWPRNITDSQHVHPNNPNDDWKDRTASSNGAGGSAGASGTTQPGLDLSDFALGSTLPDTSSTSTPSSQYLINYQGFYVPTGPYNAMPYGSIPWATQPSLLPLTTYSTLNGATSTASSSAQQQSPPLQQPSSSQPQMVIDPALTTMGSSEQIQQYTPPSNHTPEATQSTQARQPLQPQQHSLPQSQPQYPFQQSTLSVNPSYVLPSHFYSHSLQRQQPQVQTTLSPHVLHSPTTPATSGISSIQLSPVATLSTPLNPEARKNKLSTDIRPLLQPNSFTGAGAVNSLVGHLDDYGSQDVEAPLRLEILMKVRDNAGNHYFRAWLENTTAMDITRDWLKAGLTAKSDSLLVETIMPLLHIVDRLPMSVDALKASKLGKIIVKLVKDPPAPAIKDMASNLERKWRQLVEAATKPMESNSVTEDPKAKKRKPNEPPAKLLPPAKKAAVSSAPSVPKPVKKEAKPSLPAVKDSRSDSSFFSAPKPKPKLPSFKRAPAPVKKELDPNVAQPSSIDPFQEALKSMGKARKESPAAPTPPATHTPPAVTVPGPKTKRKTVTWAPDSQLESIRLIERAVYDDDPVDGVHTTHSLRDLDRGEGAALHAHLFEELIDWVDPIPIDIPIDIDPKTPGQQSIEKTVQEEREQAALGALYMNAAQIPDTPGEPPGTISDVDVDVDVKVMTVGPESDHVFWGDIGQGQQVSVADLVGQLTGEGIDQTMGNTQSTPAMSLGFDTGILASIPPHQMQQLMQQAQALFGQGQAGVPQTTFAGVDQGWGSHPPANTYTELGHDYSDEASTRGRWSSDRGRSRGRGRGRGRGEDGSYKSSKRKPCSFFAEGRCRYGDQCDFSHEPIF